MAHELSLQYTHPQIVAKDLLRHPKKKLVSTEIVNIWIHLQLIFFSNINKFYKIGPRYCVISYHRLKE